MDFRRITIEDINVIKEYIDKQPYQSCDYTLGGVFMWIDFFNYEYAIIEGFLVIRGKFPEAEELTYAYPLGSGDETKVFKYLEENTVGKLGFASVPEAALDKLVKYFGERLRIVETEQWHDYVYKYDDLAYLQGKSNSKHRNHVNKFQRLYPNYTFSFVGVNDIPAIQAFLNEYHKSGQASEISNYELKADQHAIDVMNKLNQKAGCLRIDDKIIALAMGEIVGNTLYVHIEKALREYEGSYAVINKDFALAMKKDGINYINREDDAGDEGLRTAKMNYHPIKLVKKYLVEVENRI